MIVPEVQKPSRNFQKQSSFYPESYEYALYKYAYALIYTEVC